MNKFLEKQWIKNLGQYAIKGHKLSQQIKGKLKSHWESMKEKRQGKSNPCWRGGSSKTFCLDCGKQLSTSKFKKKRCRICYNKLRLGKNNPNWKGGNFICIDCGKITSNRKAIRCFSCNRKYLTGKNHPQWINGCSFEPYLPTFNQQLKSKIRVRDNFICQLCGIPELECNRKLDIHHIDYDKQNNNLNNLLSLCRSCNSKVNFNRKKWQQYFLQIQSL